MQQTNTQTNKRVMESTLTNPFVYSPLGPNCLLGDSPFAPTL
ncbi:protein of unknown function [Candidatus Nitrosocosmicus franklandus]|uniref:Uncharacterized protein n=1 Tax=Candidatus Nitrosocosmicus franklandianus TaxID=1798806 RepID=A0A484I7V0_9ARCH|nr:protein of unknown function [Candidatus Nitrosocosmicus franklandus]